MPHSERMAPVDATWLRMDRPNNLMIILGVLKLAGPVKVAKVEKVLAERLLAYRRFRQRVDVRPSGAWWVDDPDFDISRHIRHTRLPGAGGDAELENFVAELAATPLDPTYPLWQFHIVERFQGGAAIVPRIHHAIADGIALIGVMLSLTDEMHAFQSAGGRPRPADRDEENEGWLNELFTPVEQAAQIGAKYSSVLLKSAAEITANPMKALDYVKGGTGIVSELAWLLTMPTDSPTILKGKPHGVKRVAWTEPLPLREVKAISRAIGCSVNDILLSSVAGAINAYLAEKGEETEGVEIRAVIPVNLRKDGDTPTLGNSFGLVALLLPVGMDNPVERVFEVRQRMDELKRSYEAPVVLGLLSALGYAPKPAQDMLFDLLLSRATAVMTNVPGPQIPLSMAGSEITQIMFWVPQACDVGVGVSILSYNGKVQFGLITDAALTPDPHQIIKHFNPQFEQLLYFTLMEHAASDDGLADSVADTPEAQPKKGRAPRAVAATKTAPARPRPRKARSPG